MITPLLWTLIGLQTALGLFDVLFHHELLERLAWRPSQRRELLLHAARNLIYAGVYLIFAWIEPRGLLALALLAGLAIEVVVTLVDFVEEDRSRRLPASERVTHALLALNYGAILALLAPALISQAALPTGWARVDHGALSLLASLAALGLVIFTARELAAAHRSPRLAPAPAAPLAVGLPAGSRVLITGATGFIGRRLTQALGAAGHQVTALVRDPAKLAHLAPVTLVTHLDQIPAETAFDAIVNLAGEPISDRPWTLANRRRFMASRLRMTREVARLVRRLDRPPRVLVNGSAIGWYGLRNDEILDETADARPCFSHRLCEAWERAALRIEAFGVRVVRLRIGVVLGAEGGMLSRLFTPFEFGLGGPMGKGDQWVSWIERDDLVRLIVHAIACDGLDGAVNATAPRPVRNRDFASRLGAALGRPAVLAAPAAPLRLALGDFADELLLGGQRIMPRKALASGFRFHNGDLDKALCGIVGKPWPRPFSSSWAIPARAPRYGSGSSHG